MTDTIVFASRKNFWLGIEKSLANLITSPPPHHHHGLYFSHSPELTDSEVAWSLLKERVDWRLLWFALSQGSRSYFLSLLLPLNGFARLWKKYSL